MATMVRLTQEQIIHLLEEADQMELAMKALHEELASIGTPKDTLNRFAKFHDRFTGAISYLKRQRELGGTER